jgi:hypothetical protein
MDNSVLLLVLVVVLFAIIGLLLYERRRSARLRAEFGPEYERAVEAAGGRRAAEAELDARRRRVKALELKPLGAPERDRYAAEWRDIQSRFVDEPAEAISNADDLIAKVMDARGYPVADFDQRVADISVDHPRVVEHYRLAHSIALEQRGRTGQDTEALRQAMVHYRALFLELVEIKGLEPRDAEAERRIAARAPADEAPPSAEPSSPPQEPQLTRRAS